MLPPFIFTPKIKENSLRQMFGFDRDGIKESSPCFQNQVSRDIFFWWGGDLPTPPPQKKSTQVILWKRFHLHARKSIKK